MSARIDRAVSVAKRVYDETFMRCANQDFVTLHEFSKIIREACEAEATACGVKYETVFDQLTRQLELTSDELYVALRDFVTTRDKGSSSFANILCDHCCDGDNKANIRQDLRKV